LASGTKPAFTDATEYTRHDISQALVAAAYEAAADVVGADASRFNEAATKDIPYPNSCHYTGRAVQCDAAAKIVRALTPADAQAHLDRMIAEAEARGAEAERAECQVIADLALTGDADGRDIAELIRSRGKSDD